MIFRLLSDDEIGIIMASSLRIKHHTENELLQIVKWAESARTISMILELALEGWIMIEWNGKEPVFSVNPEQTNQ